MTENETAWQKCIQANLYPGETYESAVSFYTDIDPDIQEILDAKRLIEIGKITNGKEEFQVGKLRLRNAVIKILDRPNAKEHRGYLHAYGELVMVRAFFCEDPKVKKLVTQYLEKC